MKWRTVGLRAAVAARSRLMILWVRSGKEVGAPLSRKASRNSLLLGGGERALEGGHALLGRHAYRLGFDRCEPEPLDEVAACLVALGDGGSASACRGRS